MFSRPTYVAAFVLLALTSWSGAALADQTKVHFEGDLVLDNTKEPAKWVVENFKFTNPYELFLALQGFKPPTGMSATEAAGVQVKLPGSPDTVPLASAVTAAAAAAGVQTGAADKIAADKLAADKIAADKLAADKIAADKLAADKIVADKLAADKIAADKIAADKLAADKAVAEKATTSQGPTGGITAALPTSFFGAQPRQTRERNGFSNNVFNVGSTFAPSQPRRVAPVTPDSITRGFHFNFPLPTQPAAAAPADQVAAAAELAPSDKAAADKAAADKVAAAAAPADKVAADKVAADKLAADKIAADKVAAGAAPADKVAADKVAADKLAADKLAADKLAADKLAADKLAADAAPADKVAADKVAADKLAADKLAADKLAADKLAADKLAADKLAADKLAADKIAAALTSSPPPPASAQAAAAADDDHCVVSPGKEIKIDDRGRIVPLENGKPTGDYYVLMKNGTEPANLVELDRVFTAARTRAGTHGTIDALGQADLDNVHGLGVPDTVGAVHFGAIKVSCEFRTHIWNNIVRGVKAGAGAVAGATVAAANAVGDQFEKDGKLHKWVHLPYIFTRNMVTDAYSGLKSATAGATKSKGPGFLRKLFWCWPTKPIRHLGRGARNNGERSSLEELLEGNEADYGKLVVAAKEKGLISQTELETIYKSGEIRPIWEDMIENPRKFKGSKCEKGTGEAGNPEMQTVIDNRYREKMTRAQAVDDALAEQQRLAASTK